MAKERPPTPEQAARGQRFKDLRADRGVSQLQLAAAAKVKYQTVQKWEKGTAFPKRDKLHQVLTKLETSRDYLERGVGERHVRPNEARQQAMPYGAEFDTETLEFAHAFQALTKPERRAWMVRTLLNKRAMPDEEVASKMREPLPPNIAGSIDEKQPPAPGKHLNPPPPKRQPKPKDGDEPKE